MTTSTTVVPAQPGFSYVWMWLDDGVALATAKPTQVKHGKEPVLAWAIHAEFDSDGLVKDSVASPIIPTGGNPDSGMVMLPDGNLTYADVGPMSLPQAKERWLKFKQEAASR